MANLLQVEKHLKSKKIPYKIIDLGREAYRVEDVVKVGVKADEIVKTLLVRIEKDTIKGYIKSFAALCVRGGDRIDFKKVRRIFGLKTDLAKAEEVLRVVGVPVGAVCPIKIGVPVYLDHRAMDLKNVNMGSGDLTKGLDMKFSDLKKAVGKFEVKDLIQH